MTAPQTNLLAIVAIVAAMSASAAGRDHSEEHVDDMSWSHSLVSGSGHAPWGMGIDILWPAIGCDIRMFHIRPIVPAGGLKRKNT